MVSKQFQFFWELVGAKRAEVSDLEAALSVRQKDQLEAWFEFMAMGHPEATDQDRQRAEELLQAAEDRLARAGDDLGEARRRLVIFEDYLRQCSPA